MLRVLLLLATIVAVAADDSRPKSKKDQSNMRGTSVRGHATHGHTQKLHGYGRSDRARPHSNPRREKMNYFDKAAELTKQTGQLDRAANEIVGSANIAGKLLGDVQGRLQSYHTDLAKMSNLLEGPVKNIANNFHAEFGRLAAKEPDRLAAFDLSSRGGLSWQSRPKRINVKAEEDLEDADDDSESAAARVGEEEGEDSDSVAGQVDGESVSAEGKVAMGKLMGKMLNQVLGPDAAAMSPFTSPEAIGEDENSDSLMGQAVAATGPIMPTVTKPQVEVTRGPDGKQLTAEFNINMPKAAATEPCEEDKLKERLAILEAIVLQKGLEIPTGLEPFAPQTPGMVDELRNVAVAKADVVTKTPTDLVKGRPTVPEAAMEGATAIEDASTREPDIPLKPPLVVEEGQDGSDSEKGVAGDSQPDGAEDIVQGMQLTKPIAKSTANMAVSGMSGESGEDSDSVVEVGDSPPIQSTPVDTNGTR